MRRTNSFRASKPRSAPTSYGGLDANGESYGGSPRRVRTPWCREGPPANVLAALPLSVVDRARDLLDEGARSTTGPVAAAGRGAKRALAAVGHAIERLPPFRQGEDPSSFGEQPDAGALTED